MRTRSLGFTLFAGLTLVVSACSAAATPVPATSAPATQAPATASPAASASASESAPASVPASQWKVGVVTDVGTLDDKNFNQYSFEGAENGAHDIGAASPPAIVTKDASEYAANIQKFVDQKCNVIVTVGSLLGDATAKAAKQNPDIWFVGVDQDECINATGDVDTTFKCDGNANFATLLPKYYELNFAEDQVGYLAGMVAASITKSNVVGAVGGINLVPPVVRYLQGYELGAKAINPNITVKTTYASSSDFTKAFNDPAFGKTFSLQFLKANKGMDVLFQVAGKTGNGVLDAACAANIYGIGVDVDQYVSYPAADPCIVVSAEKHLSQAVQEAIDNIGAGKATPGKHPYDAKNKGIGLSDYHDKASLIPADLAAKLQAALDGMAAGTVTTCPANCGQP